jgi:hypothetical protein
MNLMKTIYEDMNEMNFFTIIVSGGCWGYLYSKFRLPVCKLVRHAVSEFVSSSEAGGTGSHV